MWRYRNAAHYLAGIIVALSSTVNWVLPLVGFGSFMVYEIDEDWHLYDQSYQDILEFMIGFFIACVGMIAWRCLI